MRIMMLTHGAPPLPGTVVVGNVLRAWSLGLALGLAALVPAGCSRQEGKPFGCQCRWLTDRDDLSSQAVTVRKCRIHR